MRLRTTALALLLACTPATAAAACPTFPLAPGGPIEKRWLELGGCGGRLGDPIALQRRDPYTGGLYQDFERGQIVVYDRWARGSEGQMTQFVMSAFVVADTVHVRWGSTAPFSYDFFLVRWDLDGLDDELEAQHADGAQQKEAGSGAGGTTWFTVPAIRFGLYRISVAGCDEGFFLLGSDCEQGFS